MRKIAQIISYGESNLVALLDNGDLWELTDNRWKTIALPPPCCVAHDIPAEPKSRNDAEDFAATLQQAGVGATVDGEYVHVKSSSPKKQPRKFRDSQGCYWIRGFKRGQVVFEHKEEGLCSAEIVGDRVDFWAGYYHKSEPIDAASYACKAIEELWPEQKV